MVWWNLESRTSPIVCSQNRLFPTCPSITNHPSIDPFPIILINLATYRSLPPYSVQYLWTHRPDLQQHVPTSSYSALMNISFQRLNADASVSLEVNSFKCVVDPWLVSSEIDGSRFFNEAWHTSPVCSLEKNKLFSMRNLDAIVITLPFSDHCHELTLEEMDDDIPIVCNIDVKKRLEGHFGKARKNVILVPRFPEYVTVKKNVEFSSIGSEKLLDFTHGGLIIKVQRRRSTSHSSIFIAPHGMILDSHPALQVLQDMHWSLLLTTFSTYVLPLFLGGTVNLGSEKAFKLIKTLQPDKAIDIHSEQKSTRGLVPLIARPAYPSVQELQEALGDVLVSCSYEKQKVI